MYFTKNGFFVQCKLCNGGAFVPIEKITDEVVLIDGGEGYFDDYFCNLCPEKLTGQDIVGRILQGYLVPAQEYQCEFCEIKNIILFHCVDIQQNGDESIQKFKSPKETFCKKCRQDYTIQQVVHDGSVFFQLSPTVKH